jgi:hypothetical protein
VVSANGSDGSVRNALCVHHIVYLLLLEKVMTVSMYGNGLDWEMNWGLLFTHSFRSP